MLNGRNVVDEKDVDLSFSSFANPSNMRLKYPGLYFQSSLKLPGILQPLIEILEILGKTLIYTTIIKFRGYPGIAINEIIEPTAKKHKLSLEINTTKTRNLIMTRLNVGMIKSWALSQANS